MITRPPKPVPEHIAIDIAEAFTPLVHDENLKIQRGDNQPMLDLYDRMVRAAEDAYQRGVEDGHHRVRAVHAPQFRLMGSEIERQRTQLEKAYQKLNQGAEHDGAKVNACQVDEMVTGGETVTTNTQLAELLQDLANRNVLQRRLAALLSNRYPDSKTDHGASTGLVLQVLEDWAKVRGQ